MSGIFKKKKAFGLTDWRADKMSQWVKAFASKPNDLILISETNITEGKNHPQIVLMHVHVYIHISLCKYDNDDF